MPPLSPPKAPVHNTLAIEVGYFSQDLPPSTCALRQRKLKQGRRQKIEPTIKVASHRRGGQPAYLRARYDTRLDGIEWFWTDGYGKGADPRYVHLGGSPDERSAQLATAQARALSVHDKIMMDYVTGFNLEHATYWMRCRLMRHIGTMNLNQPRVTNPTQADFITLKVTRMLWPVALASPLASEALKAIGNAGNDEEKRE